MAPSLPGLRNGRCGDIRSVSLQLEHSDPAAEDLWDLEALARADRLGDWMFSRLPTAQGARVAEVGAGIGTFSQRLLDAGVRELLLIEPEGPCTARLHERFAADDRVRIVEEALPDAPALAGWAGTCDLVVCQNVLEHIADDRGALLAMTTALRPGGTLALLVPAHPWLFNRLDRRFGHQRRYSRKRLRRLAEEAGLKVDRLERFNALGILGWLVEGLAPEPGIRPGALRVYEGALRPWRRLEDRVPMPLGLSLILHASDPRSRRS
jgi:SAM-dependent methyltransferase